MQEGLLPDIVLIIEYGQRSLRSFLLGSRTIDIFANISSIMEHSCATLNIVPNSSGSRGSRLSTNKIINSCLQLLELTLNESALGKTRSEEGGVDNHQNPRALGEGDGREEETAPEQDLEDGNEPHGGIIVFLDELANHVGGWVGLGGWLATWACTTCESNWLSWLDGGNKVRTSIGCDMEDGVDAEWEHGKRVLGREKPDKGHSQVLDILIGGKGNWAGWLCSGS